MPTPFIFHFGWRQCIIIMIILKLEDSNMWKHRPQNHARQLSRYQRSTQNGANRNLAMTFRVPPMFWSISFIYALFIHSLVIFTHRLDRFSFNRKKSTPSAIKTFCIKYHAKSCQSNMWQKVVTSIVHTRAYQWLTIRLAMTLKQYKTKATENHMKLNRRRKSWLWRRQMNRKQQQQQQRREV